MKVLGGIVLPASRRLRVEIEDVHRGYVTARKVQGFEVAGVEVFGTQAKAFAEAAGIRTLASDGKLYWCGVQIAANASRHPKARKS